MKRRTLLKTAFWAPFVGLFTAKSLEATPKPVAVPAYDTPRPPATNPHDLSRKTIDVMRAMGDKLTCRPILVSADIIGADRLTRQFNVSVLERQFDADFLGFALAQRLNEHDARVVSAPNGGPFFSGVEFALIRNHGLALRGIRMYDIEYDAYVLRFDVLMGA